MNLRPVQVHVVEENKLKDRTALEKCTHLYDDTGRTIKNTSAFGDT